LDIAERKFEYKPPFSLWECRGQILTITKTRGQCTWFLLADNWLWVSSY